MLSMFSVVGLKLAGHWKRIALARRIRAHWSVIVHPCITMAVGRKAPHSAFSSTESGVRSRR